MPNSRRPAKGPRRGRASLRQDVASPRQRPDARFRAPRRVSVHPFATCIGSDPTFLYAGCPLPCRPTAESTATFAMPSFDIVSEVNEVEVRNALDQSNKEISTRFDFKGSDARVEYKDKVLTLYADDEF